MCKAMLNCLHKGEHNEVFEETTGSKDRLHHGNTSFSILDFCQSHTLTAYRFLATNQKKRSDITQARGKHFHCEHEG